MLSQRKPEVGGGKHEDGEQEKEKVVNEELEKMRGMLAAKDAEVKLL